METQNIETQNIALSSDDDDLFISMLVVDSGILDDNQTLDKFAEELQLQEVIISSLIHLPKSGNNSNDSTSENVSMEIGESSKIGAKRAGESSQSLCEICAETKDSDEMFPLDSCSHSFCRDCISKHVSIKIKKRAIVNHEKAGQITCPGVDCTSVLELDTCREILPDDVRSVWDDVLCESMISPSRKVYCPYPTCSELLVNEDDDQEAMREAECPFCKRLFCVRCNVPWHSGVDCEEFSRLSENEREKEDIMVHALAKEKKWKRCSNCKFIVEKNQGCLHMTCRCGFQFCYACGAAWSSDHGGCQ